MENLSHKLRSVTLHILLVGHVRSEMGDRIPWYEGCSEHFLDTIVACVLRSGQRRVDSMPPLGVWVPARALYARNRTRPMLAKAIDWCIIDWFLNRSNLKARSRLV
jgi:hypothetical protein